jgi:starch phosphorylase
MSGWRADPFVLRSAFGIDKGEIWNAHMEAKRALVEFVNKSGDCGMNNEDFTIGFARRQTAYKRPDLLISNPQRLIEISKKVGPMQIIYSGKAHPKDYSGKEVIKKICDITKEINKDIKMFFIPNYDITIAKLMVAGVDLWLNTPQRPNEASGTSGMKAACNGIPQFGTLDGWWIEGCIENVTGWSIGSEKLDDKEDYDQQADLNDLYYKLENKIIPKFYNDRDDWIKIMCSCIAINGSFFNTNRMLQQYVLNAYFK